MSNWIPEAVALALGIDVLIALSQELQEQELKTWLIALKNSEVKDEKELSWKEDAERFWHTRDSNELMRRYYAGLPQHLLFSLKTNLEQGLGETKTEWLLDLLQKAADASQHLLKGVPPNAFDNSLGHRLRVFPVIITAQCLPLASEDSRHDLAGHVAKQLESARPGSELSESACDQINQIIPQVLTDQLIAGGKAWKDMVVTDEVINRFVELGSDPELAARFETGLALSLQFLVYYRRSLDSFLKRRKYGCDNQAMKIDEYLRSFRNSKDPVISSMLPWINALQVHAEVARGGVQRLARQSSAAVIAYHRDNRSVPHDLWRLCVLNNLRAAYKSPTLADRDSRLERVSDFLSRNGVNRVVGLQVLEVIDRKSRSDFYEHVREFVNHLPDRADKPRADPGVIGGGHGLTVADVWSYMRPYRTGKWLERQLTPFVIDTSFTTSLHRAVAHSTRLIVRTIVSLSGEHERRRLSLTDLINRVVREQ